MRCPLINFPCVCGCNRSAHVGIINPSTAKRVYSSVCIDCNDLIATFHEFKLDNLKYLEQLSEK